MQKKLTSVEAVVVVARNFAIALEWAFQHNST
jgi:hypothetical protein